MTSELVAMNGGHTFRLLINIPHPEADVHTIVFLFHSRAPFPYQFAAGFSLLLSSHSLGLISAARDI